ncbi:aminotransferase [Novosphingobium sp. FSY-8]|uniref:Aminotransferase n=1 Tax=Novosphingobium ovatum TaxID=1908523 RepID=A0ABW9XHV9_9SPHN|nr:aminotransferase [Novosphingobium ovatum]NBC38148.1 aminotransferase [Novosphingobium ovatum]
MTPAIPTTIFERMSRAAAAAGAINLGQGYPEMAEPAELIAAAVRGLREHSNQYPPMRGLPGLRQAVADYYAAHQGLSIDPAEVIVTSGATEALAAAILAIVRPGDEVICVQPLYDAYKPLVEWAGGRVVLVSLTPPDWSLPVDALEAAITPNTRAIILNTPNNPTGTMLSHAALSAVGDLCAGHDLTLICDEVWEAMVWEGAEHLSALTIPSLRDRMIKVGSAGKLFSLTGWKLGWVVAAPALAEQVAARHQFLTYTTPTPLQWAVADGLALPRDWHDAHRDRYVPGRRALVDGLRDGGYVVLDNAASWFVTIDLTASGIGLDDETFCTRLIPEAGVAAIPFSAFYAAAPETRYVRLCFAKEAPVIQTATARLAAFRAGLVG